MVTVGSFGWGTFMAESDGTYDEPGGFAGAFHFASTLQRGRADTTTRRRGVERLDTGSAASTSRLRNFIDRLFESTMPRTAAEEAAKLRARLPSWQPVHPRSTIDAAAVVDFGPGADYLAWGRSGLLDWVDGQLGIGIRRLSTPVAILRLFALIAIVTLAMFVTCTIALSQMSGTLSTIGLQAVPAVDAAQQMRVRLGAMDVDAASDSLQSDSVATGTSREFAADVDRQIDVMVRASAGLAFGDGEIDTRLERMQYDLHLYYGILGEARDAGRTKPWIAAQRVKFASRILRGDVMSDTEALEQGDLRELDDTHSRFQEQSLLLSYGYVGMGTVLAAALIFAQIFLRQRTRRLVNVPLAIATMLLVAVMLWLGLSVRTERADMQGGETKILSRLVALRAAKADGYAIDADQAMWLIDHEANRINYEQDFDRRAGLMLGTDPTNDSELADLQARYASAATIEPPILSGLLGRSFAESDLADVGRTKLAEAIAGFLDFLRADRHLRMLEAQGDHRAALELRAAAKPGQTLFAFKQMDQALDAAIAAADTELHSRLSAATTMTSWLRWVSLTTLAAIMVLAGAGLWQRYREYR
jgi:hypothetical protein